MKQHLIVCLVFSLSIKELLKNKFSANKKLVLSQAASWWVMEFIAEFQHL